METDSSQRAVSNLDFEPRKKREFQNSSRGVGAKAPTPPAQQSKFSCSFRLVYSLLVGDNVIWVNVGLKPW